MPTNDHPTGHKPATAGEVPAAEEARHLAEEAQEALAEGDREEAHFLAEEARTLDPAAARDVLGDKKI